MPSSQEHFLDALQPFFILLFYCIWTCVLLLFCSRKVKRPCGKVSKSWEGPTAEGAIGLSEQGKWAGARTATTPIGMVTSATRVPWTLANNPSPWAPFLPYILPWSATVRCQTDSLGNPVWKPLPYNTDSYPQHHIKSPGKLLTPTCLGLGIWIVSNCPEKTILYIQLSAENLI